MYVGYVIFAIRDLSYYRKISGEEIKKKISTEKKGFSLHKIIFFHIKKESLYYSARQNFFCTLVTALQALYKGLQYLIKLLSIRLAINVKFLYFVLAYYNRNGFCIN